MKTQSAFRSLVAGLCATCLASAQNASTTLEQQVQAPPGPVWLRPYRAPTAPPIRLDNSDRLSRLIRAGRLYLTAEDAIALAIENDLGLEIDRYGPVLADWAVTRAEAGGAIRGVPSGSSLISTVASGLGVNGTVGGGGGGGGAGTGNAGGASIQQIGPVTPNLDPSLQNATSFSHKSQPQANQTVSQTSALIQGLHTYQTVVKEGFLTGGSVQLTAFEQSLQENAPTDALNPAVAPYLDLYLQQNFLQDFGIAVNSRQIRIAKLNTQAAQQQLRSELLDLVSRVLNVYWDLVNAGDQVKAAQSAFDIAQKFAADTASEVRLGVIAGVELPRAQAELSTRRQDLNIAQATVRRQENLLKDALSRTPVPELEAATIVPLDRIEVPATDNLPSLSELVKRARANRPDLAVAGIREETAQIGALGTANGLLPTLQGYARLHNSGAAGTPQTGHIVAPAFSGGYGTALGQVFRRNFPSDTVGAYLLLRFRNRQAQGDYGFDQLQLRQSAVRDRRGLNQVEVGVSNQMIALRQARARYNQAVSTRQLQQQLLTAEQNRFTFGASDLNNLILAQRALVSAQSGEIEAAAAYAHARVSLDQVLGETLEVNHITFEEGESGHVSRASILPASAVQ